LQNILGHLREVNNTKQMALDEPISNTMVVVEPKAKKKYKTKKEKEKDIVVKELVPVA
jgi:hypothetical protein